MVVSTIDILVRSIDTVEVRPGVYSYNYTRYKNIPVRIVENRTFNLSDSQQINESIKHSFDFSFIFGNDDGDRISRIYYIVYKNQIFGVSKINNYPPRVRVTPDGIMGTAIEDLGIEVVDYE